MDKSVTTETLSDNYEIIDQLEVIDFQNGANNNGTQAVRNETLAKIQIVMLAGIFVMAVFGNVLVFMRQGRLFCYPGKRLTRMKVMAAHLLCADLFGAFFNVLPLLSQDLTYGIFQGGNVLCKLTKYLQVYDCIGYI